MVPKSHVAEILAPMQVLGLLLQYYTHTQHVYSPLFADWLARPCGRDETVVAFGLLSHPREHLHAPTPLTQPFAPPRTPPLPSSPIGWLDPADVVNPSERSADDPYANEPARHPALIVISEVRPMPKLAVHPCD